MVVRVSTHADYVKWVKAKITKAARNSAKYFRSSVAARIAHEITDDAIVRNSHKRVPFACSRGCAFCCYMQTDVFAGEAFVIADAIRRMPEDRRREVIDRVRNNANKLNGVSLGERHNARIPCALLNMESRTCSVYKNRPISCRRHHALDADMCRTSIETGTTPSEIDPIATNAANLAMEGYVLAMNEPFGELHFGVLAALEPDAEKRFARGEPVFEGWHPIDHGMTEEERCDRDERQRLIAERAASLP